MIIYNKSNNSLTCIICEKVIEDEHFIKARKYDHNEFSKYSYRGYNRYGKRINIHLNSCMHQNAVSHSAVANVFNNNQHVNSQIKAQLGAIQVHNREYLKLLFQTA